MQKGFARPGYFSIDGKGIIREKFFDARYRERLTGNSLLAKLFPARSHRDSRSPSSAACPNFDSERYSRAANAGGIGSLEGLPPDVHFYAPGTKGYKPIKLPLDPIPQLQLQRVVYPPSKTLYLRAIKEPVPVLGDPFTSARISR
jgi:hypothetical protein